MKELIVGAVIIAGLIAAGWLIDRLLVGLKGVVELIRTLDHNW